MRALRRRTRADQCVECGKCTSMCPLGTRADFSARRIAAEGLDFEAGGRGVGVGRCLTCASCEQRCPQEVHFVDFVCGLREFVPEERRRPCPHGAFLDHASRVGLANGDGFRELDWLDEDLQVAEEGSTALFVGCAPLFDAVFGAEYGVRTTAAPAAAVRLLNAAGITPVVIASENCCGHDALWAGDRELYEALARANVGAFQARGVENVLTTCAECARTWQKDYPSLETGYNPRVSHMSQWIAAHLDELHLGGSETGGRVTYHDPCRLGRHLGEVEAPRQVLGALPDVELAEMSRHGRDALCCGTSGFQYCDAESRRLQSERLESARATGARIMVTACPKCRIHFACAQKEDERRGRDHDALDLVDLTELTASRLRESVTSTGPRSGPTQEPVHE